MSATTDRDDRQRSILEGPIGRGVFRIAVPSVATMLVNTFNGFLDRFFVGKLGPEALAAVTISSSLMWLLLAAAMAVGVGTSALVGRFIGAGETKDAEEATRQSLLISILLAVVVGVPMYLLRRSVLHGLGVGDDALPLASQYLLYIVLGLPSLFLMNVLSGAYRGLGDTVRPFYVTLGAVAVHAVANWLLIFGNFGFPKLGIAGGALALALSQTVATALLLLFLRRTTLAAALRGPWRLSLSWAQRILVIGIPAAIQQIIRVGSMIAFQSILAHSFAGTAAVAALGVGLVSESLAFMPGFGYSIAASAFVGQNLGAGQVERARRGAWAATWQAVLVMSLMGVVFWVFAEPFAHLFLQHNSEASTAQNDKVDETLHLAIAYLKIAAFSEPFLALTMALVGALQGAGDTKGPTILTAITMILVRLPLAYFLLQSMAVPGAWWAMSLSTMVQGLLVVLIFRQGHWQKVRV